MKISKRLFTAIALITVFGLILSPLVSPLKTVEAASITTVAVSLNPETASTATTVTITFTPATPLTTGTVLTIAYDTSFTGGAALTDADVTITGANITSTVESAFAAGYFKSTMTNSAPVTGAVTIAIGATHKLTNPVLGNYSFSVAADIGGAGTTVDTGAGLAYVGANQDDHQVLVTAAVPPVIDLELYQAGVDTLLANPNTCPLGALSLANVSSCKYDVAGTTNNVTGMTVKVQGVTVADWATGSAVLLAGSNNIDAVADGAVTAGSEEYGFNISDDGAGDVWDGSTYETTDSAVPTTETIFASTAASIDGGVVANRFEVTHEASMSGSTAASTGYQHGVVYTAYTN